MPFGVYKNFADCVAKNQSKSNPKAYCATIQKKVEGKKESKISEKFGKIDLKEIQGEYHSKGYIATTHKDSVGDIIQKETMDQWADDINSADNSTADNVSIHHKREDLNLAGRGEKSARVEQLDDGEYGLFVDTHHNKTHPDFADTVYQIDNDFLTHYSIEFDTHDESSTSRENVGGDWVRYIEPGTDLVGYGLASPRTVVNENTQIQEHGYKELIHFKEKHSEGKKMQKKEEKPAEEAPTEEPKDAPKEEPTKEAPKEEKKEDTPEEKKDEKPAEGKEDIKELKETIRKEVIADLKETVEKKKPIIVNKEKIEKKEMELKELNDFKEAMTKEPTATNYKERAYEQSKILELQWKEASNLHSALDKKSAWIGGSQNSTSSPFEIKEGKIQFKTLTTDSNYVGAQTTYWDALDNYEQTPAELNDIYGPVIINQLNEETTAWNLLPKDNMSGASAIRFRARTAEGGSNPPGSVAYGSTPNWTRYAVRRKFNLNFVTYKADVAVEFEEIELARAAGGIGDIYADEIKWATSKLMSNINVDLLTSSTTPSESEPYTFEQTIKTTGNLYGKSVQASGYTTLAAAGVDDVDSAPITLEKMRAMIDAVRIKGAKITDIAFITSYTQRRKVITQYQAIQRSFPTSARIGFEGQVEIDGVPIYPDKDANADDLWLVDLTHMRVGVKKAATYVEFGLTELKRKGIIWMMVNLYNTNPSHNYWAFDFATT
ncbi:hypothetical protein LCGC14_0598610 [marine sediment metagenome]|uniref:Uncharacterized protein n=1 Tax=marine sediment metagenome TaxID=412755 RepID=A0A0F9RBG5_9ZZZZ